MTRTRTSILVALALALAEAVVLGSTPASAQTSTTPGMSGCPDGARSAGVVAMQPLPGGGCEETVYKTDKEAEPSDVLSGKRGTRPKGDKAPSGSKKDRPEGKAQPRQ